MGVYLKVFVGGVQVFEEHTTGGVSQSAATALRSLPEPFKGYAMVWKEKKDGTRVLDGTYRLKPNGWQVTKK